jgi:hypothetical protein
MALGFRRLPGTSKRYVNVDNPLFGAGQELSYRQYAKYLEQTGERQHLATTDLLRATEARLERLRDELADRSAELDDRERALLAGEAALAEREREMRASQVFRGDRQKAGTDRYNLRLHLYMERARASGRVLTKRQAARDPEFRTINALFHRRPNPLGNPNISAANARRQWEGYARLGGLEAYQQGSAEFGLYRAPYVYRAPKPSRRKRSTNARNRARGRT